MKAASSFGRFAESLKGQVTADEFRALCFDLGLFVPTDEVFKGLVRGSGCCRARGGSGGEGAWYVSGKREGWRMSWHS